MARVGSGVRNRPCPAQDICADCGAIDPGWASINRGILLCDECCSVHRSLGRHISQVKSLTKGSWHPSELAMVHSLNNSGANHIWEHTLLDPSNLKAMRRKPQSKDPVHPNKADFIRAKHQMMSFVYKPSKEDVSSPDVSCQLHASVRTHNLEISLRLISQGADPNYFHKEKGNSPLHVAARAGQESQVELLVIYGADPGAPDKDGKTPVDYAREGGFHDIASRFLEFQYELTDRISFFLCGQKPDHSNGQHWVIPEMADSVESLEIAKEARSRLVNLPNHCFEELACDVYDEVDRRETDSIWLSNQSTMLSDRCSVPFLPVNPEFSSTRNQGRQKLARFNAREFATLIIDILIEVQRKMVGSLHLTYLQDKEKDSSDTTLTPQINIPLHQHLATPNTELGTVNISNNNKILHKYRQTCPGNSAQYGTNSFTTSTFNTAQSYPSLTSITHIPHTATRPKDSLYDEEEPLYDSVASEDDYSSWDRKQKIKSQQDILLAQTRTNMIDADYHEVHHSPERKATKSERPIIAAVSVEEYLDMKRYLELSESKIKELQDNNVVMSAKLNELSTVVNTLKEENDNLRAQSQRSSPHFQPIHGTATHKNYAPYNESPSHSHNLQNGDCVPNSPRLSESGILQLSCATSVPRQLRPCSMFESRGRNNTPNNSSFSGTDSFHQHYGSYESQSLKSMESSCENLSHVTGLPTQEEVVRKTEVITKRIQELLLSAQDSQHDKFIPCSEHITKAVKEMADLFPKVGCTPELWNAVQQLVLSSSRLQSECRNHVNSQLHILDPGRVTQQVIQCAYDIAKAAKILVTHFQ